jgi:hypothetical protein
MMHLFYSTHDEAAQNLATDRMLATHDSSFPSDRPVLT